MKKETENIATNTSAGAEKVETIEQKTTASTAKKTPSKTTVKKSTTTTAKGEAALGSESKKSTKVSAKKVNARSAGSKAEKESAAAKARVEKAIRKKEEKEKRKAARLEKMKKKKEARAKKAAEKNAAIAKRAAERKALVEKRAAAKKALAEKRKEEKEAKIRERAHGKANRNQANARKQSAKAKEREERRRQRKEKRSEREKGYGGWIAAVVSLGVLTLALATTVTVGAVEMKRSSDMIMTAYRGTMYELTGTMEHVDSDLDRLRVSASPAQQSRILTDILVQTRIAESDMEKLPISAEEDRNVTVFINRTARECERMLGKIRNGEPLNEEDRASIERMYQTTHTVREELDKLVNSMTDKDMTSFMKKGEGMLSETLQRLEKTTLEENRAAFGGQTPPCKEASADGEGKIDPARAEELCKGYFASYNVTDFQCIGETVTGAYDAYNVQGYDDKGTMLFAELRQQDGALIRFDYYEDCTAENMDVRSAELIAEEFLDKLGYDDMEVVRLRENGTTVDFTFVYEDDDVLYYPDTVQVKVCRTRGTVSGMDAHKYLAHHKERKDPEIKLTLAQAKEKLHDKLDVEASRLTVVQTARGERAAYEFFCGYAGEEYFVYLDAENGNEISIVNAKTAW